MIASKLWLFLRLSRPKQWVKNAFVFGPLLVANQPDLHKAYFVVGLFVVFCLAASTVYIWNDLIDCTRDRLHPTKCLRPIAHGDISTREAIIVFILLGMVSLGLAALLNRATMLVIIGYFVLNIAYTLYLKHVVILDLFAIATNYLLRIIGGAVVIGERITPWVIILGSMLALFLAIGKRRAELRSLGDGAAGHRKTLGEYTDDFLDRILTVTTTSIVAAYIVYSLEPDLAARLHTIWMPLTIPFVLYGLFRYLYLIDQPGQGESPSHTLLADRPLILAICGWCLTVLIIRSV